jgi:hypothetical protein
MDGLVALGDRLGVNQMNKGAGLVGIVVASIFAGRAAMQFSNLPITSPTGIDVGTPAKALRNTSPDPRPERDRSHDEPDYKALIRCLHDVDDLLDAIVTPEVFATVRPLILKRVREHVAQVSEHSQGMGKLSRAASQELQQAMNRHAASLMRANQVAPGVSKFFETQVAAVLNSK